MALIATLLLSLALADPAGATEPPDFWSDDGPEARARAVSEGELRLLARAPDKPVHHHHNHVLIDASSLVTGWVRLEQCHQHLDQVAATEIVYHPGRIRKLRILSHSGIAQARVVDHRVELRDVGPGARLCLSAETRALHPLEDGTFELRNGPYMRRFLDGYYPMRVSMTIDHPRTLGLLGHEPEAQPGFAVTREEGRVAMDTWFEGKLYTRFRFCTQPCITSPKSTSAGP